MTTQEEKTLLANRAARGALEVAKTIAQLAALEQESAAVAMANVAADLSNETNRAAWNEALAYISATAEAQAAATTTAAMLRTLTHAYN